jgi:uncharacterized protein YbjT (DUF2867 family)
MTSERVFILGGTGNIGKQCVQDLLDHQIPVTLYARQPEKVHSMFSSDLVQTVQGDFSDLSPLKKGVKGHTRLFLLVPAHLPRFAELKATIAQHAYDAGVQQVVDISSFCINKGWRFYIIGELHYRAEKAILELPNRQHFVALRPGRFMSNHFHMHFPVRDGALLDTFEPDQKMGWISPNDIGAVAAVVLRESVEKHGDAVYNLTGDVVSSAQRADIIARVTGREDIKYCVVSSTEKYDQIMSNGHTSHLFAVDLVDKVSTDFDDHVTPVIEILLRRKPQTLEEYMVLNKSKIQ